MLYKGDSLEEDAVVEISKLIGELPSTTHKISSTH